MRTRWFFLNLMVSLLATTTASAQEPAGSGEPSVAILNPAHDSFLIPPFRVEGRAAPGEKLGVFINGYRQTVVQADEHGRFSTKVAWTHDGPLWIEVRRGDERRHAIQVRVADVSPVVAGRVLPAEPDSSAASGAKKLTPTSEASTRSTAEPMGLSQTSSTRAGTSWGTRFTGSLIAAVVAHVATLTLLGSLRGKADFTTIAMGTGITSSGASHAVQVAIGNAPDPLVAIASGALPTLMVLAGAVVESDAMALSGFLLQPVVPAFFMSF